MADFTKVEGRDIGDIKVFALSTCGWCKKTKTYLKDHGIKFSYIDVDQLVGDELSPVREQQLKFNPNGSFPTIVVADKDCIIGYDEDALRKLIGE